MRLFIGISLADAVVRQLAAAAAPLRSNADNLRWTAPESWHITLQFLGTTTPQQYECVTAHLRDLHHPPIAIELGPIGTFPRAGVLFADVRVTPRLIALQQAVIAATTPCGFNPEERPYHPHITIARQKGRGGDKQFRSLKLPISPPHFSSFTAESFLLYESIPTPEGSRYEIRERFPLRP
jgi:RNA 2',3'-cyclic 3'-phosphodiesterase